MDSDSERVEALIERKVGEAVKANNAELLGSIQQMMHKISPRNESTCNLLQLPKFKKRGHEEQYKYNARVIEQLESAEKCIETADIPSAKTSISEGKYLFLIRVMMVF